MKYLSVVLSVLFAGCVFAADPLVVFFIDTTFEEYSGDAMIVCTPGGRYYVIDGGPMSAAPPVWDCGEDRVLPLLDSLGVTYLDGVVGTHLHADHVGGLISVYNTLPVVTAYDSGWPYGGTWTYETYLEAILNNGSDFIISRRGDILNWGPELTVEVIHPVDPLSQHINNSSIVIRLTYDAVSFLFTGDLEVDGGEDAVLAALSAGEIDDISADVLKVGHHGSYTSTSTQWLAEVNPSIAAICVGGGNPYGHPHSEVINRLLGRDITIYRTDLHGTFYISSDGEGVYYNSMPPSGGGGTAPIDEFAVFPSPATSAVTFMWNASEGQASSIMVFNLNGEKLLDVIAASGSYTWNLSTGDGLISPGLYAVVFRTSGGETCTEYFAVSR